MDVSASGVSYLKRELLFTQIENVCNNVSKALPHGADGVADLVLQARQLETRREPWPQRIITVWKNCKVPVFSAESITKLNQNWIAEAERVNDSRKRHKNPLRADIKHIDDNQTKRAHTHDNNEMNSS